MPPRRRKRKLSRINRTPRSGPRNGVVVSTINLPDTFSPVCLSLDTHRDRLVFTNFTYLSKVSLGIYDIKSTLTSTSAVIAGVGMHPTGVSHANGTGVTWISTMIGLVMFDFNSPAIAEMRSKILELTIDSPFIGSPFERGCVDGKFNEARFDFVGGTLGSSDGKSLYVCDRHNLKIRHIDLTNQKVCTVATFFQLLEMPEMLCFDRRVPCESVLYIATRNTLRRLKLPESASDVFRYCIDAVAGSRVLSALLRYLWYIVASYLAEITPSLTEVPGSHRTSVVAMLLTMLWQCSILTPRAVKSASSLVSGGRRASSTDQVIQPGYRISQGSLWTKLGDAFIFPLADPIPFAASPFPFNSFTLLLNF
jgi:hypothetical protein